MPTREMSRDHGTLDKQLKEYDAGTYTDDYLQPLTLNDKQNAVQQFQEEEVAKKENASNNPEDASLEGSRYVLNPIEIHGEVVDAVPTVKAPPLHPVTVESRKKRNVDEMKAIASRDGTNNPSKDVESEKQAQLEHAHAVRDLNDSIGSGDNDGKDPQLGSDVQDELLTSAELDPASGRVADRKGSKKSTSKKSTAKKSTAKKATAKKATAKKSAKKASARR